MSNPTTSAARHKQLVDLATPLGCSVLSTPDAIQNCEDYVSFQCACGKPFQRSYIATVRYHASSGKLRCRRCSYDGNTGPAHVHWKASIPQEVRESARPSNEIYAWYRAVAKEYAHTCAITHTVCKNGSAHHLFSAANYPDLALDLRNGVWITREHHKAFHDQYGRGKNTLEQFQQYFKFVTGLDFVSPFEEAPRLLPAGDVVNLVTEATVRAYCTERGIDFLGYIYKPHASSGNKHDVSYVCRSCRQPTIVNWYKLRRNPNPTLCGSCRRHNTLYHE